jgi:hypothetical protein
MRREPESQWRGGGTGDGTVYRSADHPSTYPADHSSQYTPEPPTQFQPAPPPSASREPARAELTPEAAQRLRARLVRKYH